MTSQQESKGGQNPMEAMTSFWTEMFSKLTPQPPQGMTAVQPEFIKQMQQSFFDTMGRSFSEFMRSEQFLQMMKQSMDNALLFRQQMNKFLTSTAHGMGATTLEDTNNVVQAIHNVEDRMNEKLAALGTRLEGLERALADGSNADVGNDKNRRPAAGAAKPR